MDLDESAVEAGSRAVRWMWVLVAITAVVSLLYAIQYYAGGPVQLPVVSPFYDLDQSPDQSLVAAGAMDGIVRVWQVPESLQTRVPADWNVAAETPWPV